MAEGNGVRQVFSERLRELREAAGLTQQELAEKLDWSRGSISFYEKCQRCPDIEFLKAASTFFGVSADWFIGLSDVKSPHADIQGVCAFTGLSETSVGSILRETANEETQRVMNVILGFDPDCFHRFIQSVRKGITIIEKYKNKSINLELIPTEIKEDLYCLLGIEDGGIYDPVGNSRDRYFTKAKGYLDLILTGYTVSPDGKPMVSFDFEEDSVEKDGVPHGID